MLLLTARDLPELLLRHTLHEPLQTGKHLLHTLLIQRIHLRLPDQRLNLHQTVAIQMITQTLIDLLQHLLKELGAILATDVKHLVDEASLHELLAGDALAHDEGLVGLADSETAHEADGGVALGDETERRERREEEGVGRGVDEVGEGDQGGGETDGGAIERRHQDLGVRVEGVGDVQVVGDEALEPEAALVIIVGLLAADGDISTTIYIYIY